MNPLTFIGDIARAVAALFGFAQKKIELNNTPEMQDRAQTQKEVKQNDSDSKSIRDGDLDDLRKRGSE